MAQITVHQEEIEVEGHKLFATHIPTATSGCWYTVHDLFELWAAVAIDLDGTVIGWRNPPEDEKHRAAIEEAIRKAFGIPEALAVAPLQPSKVLSLPPVKRKEYSAGECDLIPCPGCGSTDLQYTEVPDHWKCQNCGKEGEIKTVIIFQE